jgi:hypothetical protein
MPAASTAKVRKKIRQIHKFQFPDLAFGVRYLIAGKC